MQFDKTKTTNEWKETVREIYDMLQFSKHTDAYDLKDDLINLIESRHHSYFCEEHYVQQNWNDKTFTRTTYKGSSKGRKGARI